MRLILDTVKTLMAKPMKRLGHIYQTSILIKEKALCNSKKVLKDVMLYQVLSKKLNYSILDTR